MGSWLLPLTVCVSIVPLLLGAQSPSTVLFGLALCPWMVFVGLPRGPKQSESQLGLLSLAFAAPVLGLALALDTSGGALLQHNATPWQAGLGSVICLTALLFAAHRAGEQSRWHGLLWVSLVLLAPVLGWLITNFTDHNGAAHSGLPGEALSDWSPLSLCMRLAAGDERALANLSIACTGATLAILLAAAEFDRRRA